jgi:tripartite-type tricarboxylate transporter receptor subunit TctC
MNTKEVQMNKGGQLASPPQEEAGAGMTRRRVVLALSGVPAWCGVPKSVMAQTRQALGKIIVGFPAGGTMDTVARRLAEAWHDRGTYVVENRAGAGGRIATGQLKREKADGTILLCSHTSAFTIYPHVYTKLGYHPSADVKTVAALAETACAFAISSSVPADVHTLADYVRWAKKSASGSVYATPAAGTLPHFLGYRFAKSADISLTQVPYRGSMPAVTDLLGGQVPAFMGFIGDFLPYLSSGKIRLLATSSERRSPYLPGVPTFAEQGHATVIGIDSYAFFVPPETPDSIVSSLSEAVRLASRDGKLLAGFEQIGLRVNFIGPAEYSRLISAQRETWKPVVAASGFVSDE